MAMAPLAGRLGQEAGRSNTVSLPHLKRARTEQQRQLWRAESRRVLPGALWWRLQEELKIRRASAVRQSSLLRIAQKLISWLLGGRPPAAWLTQCLRARAVQVGCVRRCCTHAVAAACLLNGVRRSPRSCTRYVPTAARPRRRPPPASAQPPALPAAGADWDCSICGDVLVDPVVGEW